MGCTSSAYICQQVTSALAHIYNSWGALCTNYLEDFIGVAPPPEKAEKDFWKLGWLLQDIIVWESEHKACPPSSVLVVLGILFNTINRTILISPDRVDEIQAELDAWHSRAKMSHKQLESFDWEAAVCFPSHQSRLCVFGLSTRWIERLPKERVCPCPLPYHPRPKMVAVHYANPQWYQVNLLGHFFLT